MGGKWGGLCVVFVRCRGWCECVCVCVCEYLGCARNNENNHKLNLAAHASRGDARDSTVGLAS